MASDQDETQRCQITREKLDVRNDIGCDWRIATDVPIRTVVSSAAMGAATMSYCIGVDGAKSGWIAVWSAFGHFEFEVYGSASAVCADHLDARVIAVDIPIGLSDAHGRAADVQARKFVGGVRASSIFSSPVRGVLDAKSQPEASARHRVIDGRGFGAQSFAILPKIREWDACLRANEHARGQVHEIHPEVCFAALDGSAGLRASKKSDEGAARRIELLSMVFGQSPIQQLLERVPRNKAAREDVLDAVAALWSAHRIARGIARSLPSPPQPDSQGLGGAIWY